MATNYTQFDTVRGKEVWAVPACLILGAGLLWGIVNYCNNHSSNLSHYNPDPEIRAVEHQRGLEKLADKYRR